LKLICSILILSIIITGSGCRSDTDGSGFVFIFDLPANPYTLDPQTAVAEHERLVIANLFDGLLRMDSGGNITAGVAMEYEISEDEMTYTFYLKDDVFWMDAGEFRAKCTAHDFVFAFQRLFNPQVKSRNSADYFSILNSSEIRKGNLPLEYLGVTAEDDFTLIIQLEYPDSNLPVLLSAPPAFPCNEEFYLLSAGRYGLTAGAVASNGGFFVREWVYDPHWTYENRIILRYHEKNHQSERVYPLGVNFYMDRGRHLGNFTAGNAHCIVLSGNDADDLKRRDFPYAATENSVWGITFNQAGVFSDENLRLGLAHAVDREAVDFERTGYTKTSSVIPDGIKIADVFYRDLVRSLSEDVKVPQANTAQAARLFNMSSHLVDSAGGSPVLIVPIAGDDEAVVSLVRAISQQWQEKLSLFCRIEVLDPNEYARRLADGNYDMAVVKITAGYNSPSAILEQLTFVESTSGTPEEIARYYLAAENRVIASAEFIPLCFMTEYFFRHRKSEDLVYNTFTGAVVFRQAKMF
jgi:oligopeptide transport system substrate-binding protein